MGRRAYEMGRRNARRVGELTLMPPRRRARLRCDQQCRPGVGDDLRDVMQLLEIVLAVLDKGRESDGSQVTYGGLVRRRVLDDLGAEVGRLDRAEILLVRLG